LFGGFAYFNASAFVMEKIFVQSTTKNIKIKNADSNGLFPDIT